MHPVLFRLGGLEVPTFGILALIGFAIALILSRREAVRLGFDARKVEDLLLLSAIGGWVGAKGLYALQNPGIPLGLALRAGYVFYGGVLFAVPTAWLLARRAGIPGLRLVDIYTPGMVLGLALGRVGCLCAGCDYGRPAGAAHWWTLAFTYDASVPTEMQIVPQELRGLPLWPTQPLMALSLVLAFAIVYRARLTLTPWPGAVIFLYLAVEPPMRFAIEFVRGDADRGLYGALSTSQWLAAVMAPAALAALLWQVRRGRAAPIDSVASAYYTQRLDSSTRP